MRAENWKQPLWSRLRVGIATLFFGVGAASASPNESPGAIFTRDISKLIKSSEQVIKKRPNDILKTLQNSISKKFSCKFIEEECIRSGEGVNTGPASRIFISVRPFTDPRSTGSFFDITLIPSQASASYTELREGLFKTWRPNHTSHGSLPCDLGLGKPSALPERKGRIFVTMIGNDSDCKNFVEKLIVTVKMPTKMFV
jgi:hypothetical protein